MKASRFKTYDVPQVSGSVATPTPATIAVAGRVPLRVVVRNVSAVGSPVFLSAEQGSVSDFPPSSDSYELPPGMVDTFVLAPEMRIYASAGGANCRVSVATSDALPVDLCP